MTDFKVGDLALADRNVCAHADHYAPPGMRFCSDWCLQCDEDVNIEEGQVCAGVCGKMATNEDEPSYKRGNVTVEAHMTCGCQAFEACVIVASDACSSPGIMDELTVASAVGEDLEIALRKVEKKAVAFFVKTGASMGYDVEK